MNKDYRAIPLAVGLAVLLTHPHDKPADPNIPPDHHRYDHTPESSTNAPFLGQLWGKVAVEQNVTSQSYMRTALPPW